MQKVKSAGHWLVRHAEPDRLAPREHGHGSASHNPASGIEAPPELLNEDKSAGIEALSRNSSNVGSEPILETAD